MQRLRRLVPHRAHRRPMREQAAPAQDRQGLADDASDHAARRILLVDNEPELRHLMREILQEAGYLVETSYSFSDAKETLQHGDFDLVLTELLIGGGTRGADLASMARANGMASLLITGNPDQIQIMRLKHERFLAKPFTREALVEYVDAVWSVRRAPG